MQFLLLRNLQIRQPLHSIRTATQLLNVLLLGLFDPQDSHIDQLRLCSLDIRYALFPFFLDFRMLLFPSSEKRLRASSRVSCSFNNFPNLGMAIRFLLALGCSQFGGGA